MSRPRLPDLKQRRRRAAGSTARGTSARLWKSGRGAGGARETGCQPSWRTARRAARPRGPAPIPQVGVLEGDCR